MDNFEAFLHHPWASTCQAVHNWTHQKNQNINEYGFHACVDVSNFEPSEITVKTVDNTVIIEAKHNERDDAHGPIERYFVRKYILPNNYDVETLSAIFSPNGVLTIEAPVPTVIPGEAKHVSIAHTDVPIHMNDYNKFEDPIFDMSMVTWPVFY